MKTTIICDLDGTLADVSHRIHHIRTKGRKDWKSFQAEENIMKDIPNLWCLHLLLAMESAGYKIILVSGRWEKARGITLKWLHQNVPLKSFELFLRGDGDFREDSIVKQEILDRDLKKDEILFVIEDRQQVVDMWRQNGLVCLQCEEGNF